MLCVHEVVFALTKMSAMMQRHPLGSVSVLYWSNLPSPMLWIESQEKTLWVQRAALDGLLPERTEFPHLAALLKGTLGSEVIEFWTASVSWSFPSGSERTVFSTTEWPLYLAVALPGNDFELFPASVGCLHLLASGQLFCRLSCSDCIHGKCHTPCPMLDKFPSHPYSRCTCHTDHTA